MVAACAAGDHSADIHTMKAATTARAQYPHAVALPLRFTQPTTFRSHHPHRLFFAV